MPVNLTEDDGFPPPVETVMDHGDDYEEGDDDEASCATGTSVSDYTGDVEDRPSKMFFGKKECKFIFEQASDHGKFTGVCGAKLGQCKRPGHNSLIPVSRAVEGYNDLVNARK